MEILNEHGADTEIINYLDNPPSPGELSDIIKKLGISAFDLIRKKEAIFQEKYKGKSLSDHEWILAMIEHPILIERPIIINGNKAVIGRPPVKVLDII